jgi:hypothetical protein
MKAFLQRHASKILGVLSGFDRVRFRGTFRRIVYPDGMLYMLSALNVLLKDFKQLVTTTTQKLRDDVEFAAQKAGLPVHFVKSSKIDKEKIVDQLVQERGVGKDGVLAILSCVELCQSFQIHRNRERKTLDLQSARRQCLHYYLYLQDSMFGRVSVRLQTWFPFNVHICINGREWLARQMDAARIRYSRRDNCFTSVSDFARAQTLLDHQLRTDWPKHLTRLLDRITPNWRSLTHPFELQPYWTVDESEWATDLAFRSAEDLANIYSRLLHHAITSFGSRDVMRFLGRRIPAHGGINGHFTGEVVSKLHSRPEGMCIKHRLNRNSLKMYDKQGSVLRIEATINDAYDLKAYRPKEGDPKGPKQYRCLRKGVADTRRRAQLCQSANKRYLEALATADTSAPLKTFTDKLCQPTEQKGRRYRALNPFGGDADLLQTITRGEFIIKGFRNVDVRKALFGADADDPVTRRRQSSRISRLLALLRVHGLIKKIQKTHRYQLTTRGRKCLPAILVARETSVEKLIPAA